MPLTIALKYASYVGKNIWVKINKYQVIVIKNMVFIWHGAHTKDSSIPNGFGVDIHLRMTDLVGLVGPIDNASLGMVKFTKQIIFTNCPLFI